jgi:hypothetical protein
MKMVKKCIFALAVIALLVTVVPAGTPDDGDNQPDNIIKRDGDWPWTYKAIDLCTMPIYMDVGHFVQLKDCGDREVILKQVTCTEIGKNNTDDFPCYKGCEAFEVRANFPAIFGGEIDKIGPILTDTDVKWVGDKFQINGGGDWESLEVCVLAWKAEIWQASGPDDKTHVGDLRITVKPPDGGTP